MSEHVKHISVVQSLLEEGRDHDVAAHISASDLSPNQRALVFRHLGTDLMVAGNVELSIKCRRWATQFVPNDPVPHLELLRSLYRVGRIDDALQHAEGVDLSVQGVSRHDFSPTEKVIFSVVGDIAIASPEVIVTLARATTYVLHNDIPGAFVECGVYRGGSTMAAMLTCVFQGISNREFWLYDTFSGMPEPGDLDVYFDGRSAKDEWQQKMTSDGKSGWVASSLEETLANVTSTGYPSHLTRCIEGLVEETIPERTPDQIAFLRLDTDFYSSTKHELEHLFPRVSRGGVVLIDDYGAFKGAAKAVDEYFEREGLRIFLNRVDGNVRLFVKHG